MGQNDNRPKTYARGSQGGLIKLRRLSRVCNFFENLESRSERKNLTKIESERSVESV